MNKKEYLQTVIKQIRFRFDRNAIEEELNQHLNDSIQDLMEEGFCKEDAERIAVEQMGDPVETGKALNQEHHPVIGYLWMFSKVALVLVAIPGIWFFFMLITGSVSTLISENYKATEVSYPLEIEHEMSTHYLKLDDICKNSNGDYYITFRAFPKLNYARAEWSMHLFEYGTSAGERYFGGGMFTQYGMGFTKGNHQFIWPEDNLLYVIDQDGEWLEIDLEEYWHEPEQKVN